MRQLAVLRDSFSAQAVGVLVIDRAVLENVYLVAAKFAAWLLLEQLTAKLQGKETRLDLGAIKDVLDLGLETRPPKLCRSASGRLAGDRQTDLRLGE